MFGSPKPFRSENQSSNKHTNDSLDDGSTTEYNNDCSNSSWAEMSSYIVGTYQMFPVTNETKQVFILKYLRPVGEYQEVIY